MKTRCCSMYYHINSVITEKISLNKIYDNFYYHNYYFTKNKFSQNLEFLHERILLEITQYFALNVQ